MNPIHPETKIDAEGNLHVPAKVIPLPSHVSDAARFGLSQWFIPGMDAWPAEGDEGAWRAFIAKGDAFIREALEPLKGLFNGTIEAMRIDHCALFCLTPDQIVSADRAILYLHGGAYIYGAGEMAAIAAIPVALESGCRVYSCDYRMPPDHPFPAAVEDAVLAYEYLLNHFAPAQIGVMGLSAGAGLAASCILKARDQGLPLPGAAALFSPEADLTESGDSFETNRWVDTMIRDRMAETNALYAGGHDLSDPYLSPVFGDFAAGFPPTLLVAGTRDLFLSNTVLLHRALVRAGLEADLHVFEAMPHGGFFSNSPEDREVMTLQLAFLAKRLNGLG